MWSTGCPQLPVHGVFGASVVLGCDYKEDIKADNWFWMRTGGGLLYSELTWLSSTCRSSVYQQELRKEADNPLNCIIRSYRRRQTISWIILSGPTAGGRQSPELYYQDLQQEEDNPLNCIIRSYRRRQTIPWTVLAGREPGRGIGSSSDTKVRFNSAGTNKGGVMITNNDFGLAATKWEMLILYNIYIFYQPN